jgi:ATP-dependent RNA helicase RhlB
MVVNYDLPIEAENYVHRIGRTARAGKTGKAVTLASEQDVYELPPIERYIGKKIPSETATEELFGEDKSAGMRIRTERYDDDRRPVSRGGGHDRSGGRRASSSDGEARRHPGHGREHGGRSAEGVRSRDERRPPRRDRTENRETPPDISGFSMEERMAYYRRKYDKTAGQAGSDSRAAGQDGGRAENRRGGRERPAAGTREAARKKGDAGAGSGKQAAGQQPRRGGKGGADRASGQGGGAARRNKPSGTAVQGGKKAGTGQMPNGTGAPQKKGLLSRLLGIFKPKKQKE